MNVLISMLAYAVGVVLGFFLGRQHGKDEQNRKIIAFTVEAQKEAEIYRQNKEKEDAQKTISFVNLPENGIKWAMVFR